MRKTAEKITAQVSGIVRTDEVLSRHTSFKIGGPADLFVEPVTMMELVIVLSILRQEEIPVYLLGSGTNLLVSDAGYRGAVVRLAGEFKQFVYENCCVEAGAAVPLAWLASDAGQRGLAGLDFAAGIPGTVGGALVMNAGAHGSVIGDVLTEALILDEKLRLHSFAAEDLGLFYRKSNITSGSVVCRVKLRLSQGEKEIQARKCGQYLRFRREHQPHQPNAGSIFKNPPHDFAGRLIEAAGLKGRRVGGAMISDLHANFIVNCGNASATDVRNLLEMAREEVARQFGVNLELEIRLLGY
ncbi:MAG: UDP-N-acetylenolpyruvoylglucosamine reductase [Dehalococcoidia bacterium]|nr:UDP-N-acetylenolpyruvoylglucosamine reductase [Bacillota bacterium]